MFLRIDGGGYQISNSGTHQGVHHRRFLALMVDALGSPAPAPLRGPIIDVFYVDGERSRISISTLQGVSHRRFLALMMSALGSPTLPPRGPAADVLHLSGSRSQNSGNTSQGATMSRMFLSKSFFGSLCC
jgi:hypothetical protein